MRQYIPPPGMSISEAIGNALIIAREHSQCVFVFNGTPVVVKAGDSPRVVESLWRRTRTVHNAYRELVAADSDCAGR